MTLIPFTYGASGAYGRKTQLADLTADISKSQMNVFVTSQVIDL